MTASPRADLRSPEHRLGFFPPASGCSSVVERNLAKVGGRQTKVGILRDLRRACSLVWGMSGGEDTESGDFGEVRRLLRTVLARLDGEEEGAGPDEHAQPSRVRRENA